MKRILLEALDEARRQKKVAVMLTHLRTGAQALVVDGKVTGDFDVPPDLLISAEVAARTDESRTLETDDGTVFVHVFSPPLRMIVVGAVHIAQALIPMAKLAGFEVTLVDPRTAFATPERFPGTRIVPEWTDRALGDLAPDSRTAVVALTHNPKLDEPALAAALRSPAFYIGALGSRRSAVSRNGRLKRLGFGDADIARINGPIGVNIGARTSAEIAVAIMAQVIKALRTGAP
jgi:xanthine dehydrogenase accessory factor